MERLTKKFTDGVAYCEEIEDVGIKSINSKTYVGKAINKLAEFEDLEEKCIEEHGVGLRTMIDKFGEFIDDIKKYNEYNDLEEKGMLLKLPCKVGDTVYIIRETQMCCYGKTCDKDISCKECIMLNTHEIHETKFDLSYFYEFGKSVFLTKEEAEQALKKMEGEG